VLAAISIPTRITEIPSPPRRDPNSIAMVSSRFSATRERSSITPMNTNSGHRDQRLVGHDAVKAVGQRLEIDRLEQAEELADQREGERSATQ
jgi:hypothetical protein